LERNGLRYGRRLGSFLGQLLVPERCARQLQFHQLTRKFADLCVRCFGIHGCADTHYGGLVRVTCEDKQKEWLGAEKDDTFRGGCVTNIKEFTTAIRAGKAINSAEAAVESNLTAILGRMAAYRERTVTWEEMMASTEKWEAGNLKLKW